MRSSWPLLALILPLFLNPLGCGGECDGTIFVNESETESVTVSATTPVADTDVSFETFTLGPGGQEKVCGDDTKSIIGTYTWPNGDTDNLGQTSSTGDICIFLTTSHTAESASAGAC